MTHARTSDPHSPGRESGSKTWSRKSHLVSWLLLTALLAALTQSGCVGLTGAESTSSNSNSKTTTTQTLSASATNLTFSNLVVGSTSKQSVTIANSGNSSVDVLNVSFSGAGFTPDGVSSGLILQAGQTATLNVTFAPATAGTVTGSITITSTASNPTLTIHLSGSSVSPSPHSVSLSWDAGASISTVFGYNVYRSTVSGSSYVRMNSPLVTNTQFTDSTVQSGKTYYYVVTAVDFSGMQSAYSSQAKASIP